jgi:poly(U)-specific endoribonuclease
MSTEIYQEVWDADQDTNGIPALRPGDTKSESTGYVVVDERDTSVPGDHKVLAEVQIPESKRETYRLCEKLFNNYTLDPGIREQVRVEETQEEMDFVDAIL